MRLVLQTGYSGHRLASLETSRARGVVGKEMRRAPLDNIMRQGYSGGFHGRNVDRFLSVCSGAEGFMVRTSIAS